MEIGERLRSFRTFKGETLEFLAEQSGISKSQLSNMETGSNFRIDFLFKLLDAYPEMNMNWLLTGQGDMLNVMDEPSQSQTDSATTHVQAGLDKVLSRLTAEEKAVIFNSTQEMLSYRAWRESVQQQLDELKAAVKALRQQ